MPIYKLYTRAQGVSTWTYSGYQLQIAGAGNGNGQNGLNVMARTYPNVTPPNPGQWQTVSGVSRNGNGTPNNPQNGDELSLPSTISGLSVTLTGDGTYSTTGDTTLGAGYYTDESITGDPGDWCATSN